MNEFVSANWPLVLIALAVGIVLLWWVIAATRRTRVSVDRRDALDEGAAPAARNQALIDAAPAGAVLPSIVPETLGAIGVAVATPLHDTQRDDLTRIKGLGPKLATTLQELGVTRFDQVGGWSDADIDRIDAQLGRFQGRIRRDAWVEQARLLAAGDHAAFESKFGAQ